MPSVTSWICVSNFMLEFCYRGEGMMHREITARLNMIYKRWRGGKDESAGVRSRKRER
jgi:hypothetical protein